MSGYAILSFRFIPVILIPAYSCHSERSEESQVEGLPLQFLPLAKGSFSSFSLRIREIKRDF